MNLTVHATNITGLGACQVVLSFLKALENSSSNFERILVYVPESGPVSEIEFTNPRFAVERFRRKGPKAISRVLECLFPHKLFQIDGIVLVLGDVPLRTKARQTVLIHQPHLLSPEVNSRVGRSLSFRTMRLLTKLNAPFADQVIVQTDAMLAGILASYKNWRRRECVRVVGQPPPSWFDGQLLQNISPKEEGLQLFYPAADYPHKNHQIFESIDDRALSDLDCKILLTINPQDTYRRKDRIRCIGRLNQSQCLAKYHTVDALVYPSVLESYGLPLVEAMSIGLPILVADLPYAHALCGSEAIYFDPDSSSSLLTAIQELQSKISDGWKPDWSTSLGRLPHSWEAVVGLFFNKDALHDS